MGATEVKDRPTAPTFPFNFALPEDSHHLSPQAMALVVRHRCSGRGPPPGNAVDGIGVAHPLLELCLTGTKGLGLFAKQDIERGTCVLSETSLLALPSKDHASYHDLQEQLAKLDDEQLDVFCSLSSGDKHCCPGIKLSIKYEATITQRPVRDAAHLRMEAGKITTFDTNATPMSSDKQYGIFPLFSRINHDCTPNVYASYNPTTATHTVYATRDIKAQDELLTSYVDPAQSMLERAHNLQSFDVDCECPSCMPGKIHLTSEKRRRQIAKIRSGLATYDGTASPGSEPPGIVPTDPSLALNMAEAAIELMRAEQLANMHLTKLHRQASKYSLRRGMADKARSHAQKEAQVERLCLGTETEYLNAGQGDGNAATWASEVERIAEKDRVKIRMCEKREVKDKKKAQKKADKKADKKAGKKGRR